jgi:MFS transporter, FHS family, Na+ dependent glucose transporter 1
MPEFRLPVVAYLTTFLVVGFSLSILGPALTELRARTGSDIAAIGVLFVGQSSGYIIGSLFGGRLYDRLDGHRVAGGALVVMAAGLAVLPHFDHRIGLLVAVAVLGTGAATADIGINTLLLWQLGSSSGRAMNMLHLCFGIGALSAPLLVHASFDISVRGAGLMCLALAAWLVAVPAPGAPPAREEQAVNSRPMLALLSLFFVLYVGMEVGFAGWVQTYGEEIRFSELAATWLTTTFWIGFTLGRLLASALGHRFRPKVLLIASCSMSIAAALVLIVGDGRTAAVWAGAAVMGMATAPQFPVMLTYLERRIRVTGRATSWFVGGAGVGGLIFPWLIGRWFDARGATTLPWAMLVLGLMTFASFGVANRRLGG